MKIENSSYVLQNILDELRRIGGVLTNIQTALEEINKTLASE